MKKNNTFTILTYNIHKGKTPWGTLIRLEEMKSHFIRLKTDLIFLQETATLYKENKAHSILEQFSDSLWKNFAYGKNASYTEGDHGNAILSQYPILTQMNHEVSAHWIEKRGALYNVINIPEKDFKINLFCVHLGLTDSWRRKQVNKITQWVLKEIPSNEPLLIVGDFNDWNKKLSPLLLDTLNLNEAFLTLRNEHAKTYPSFFPFLCLDRIYYRGLKLLDAQCLSEDPWKQWSDHLPLTATFEIP